MALTDRQVHLIQQSFHAVIDEIETVAAHFFRCLHEIAPDAQRFFHSGEQMVNRKLMQTMLFAANSMNDAETFTREVQAMGQRHAAYGVQPEHYMPVGTALLWALQQTLGERFTAEMKGAWKQAYLLLMDTALTGITENEWAA